MEEDKETELLFRVAANHLVLGQFEPFRAILRTLRNRNPTKARAILQSIVASGGKLDNIIWAPHSCPSPSLLTFLSTLELLQYEDPVSGLWSFDGNILKLRAEFLLYVQMVCYKVLERVKKGIEVTGLEGDKMGSVNFDSPVEFLVENEEFLGLYGEDGEGLKVLVSIYSVGLSRLAPESIVVEGQVEVEGSEVLEWQVQEMTCLKRIILEIPETFDALCRNIELQVGFGDKEVSKMDMKSRLEEAVLKTMQSCVQTTHLDAMKECLGRSDLDGAISHLQFLHLDYGVEEVEYRVVLEAFIRIVFSGKIDYGSTWFAMREKVLRAYVEMLSSCCTRLVQMIQDELLSAEIEKFKASRSDQTHIPLHHLQNFVADFNHETFSGDKESYVCIGSACCRIEMFHYARVGGFHVLECVMEAALTAVKGEHLQEANSVLQLFPRLKPLVAVMGWDTLTGKTGLRRKLLQLLWTSKSQVLRMEESQLYHNKSDEVSCIEHLCDLLCYQLDLASFVACVNSGNSWSSKSTLLLSSKESLEFGSEIQWDPFVETYVLERLSIQSPLRVLFDVVPSIKFHDAVELISMAPIDSALAAWKRMQDVELMHMRYALESAIFALGSMEKCATATAKDREMTFWHLKDLKSHLDAIHSNPRKILMVNIVISLVYMVDLSFNITPYATPISSSGSFDISWWEGADVAISDGGNKMCTFFAGKMVDILKQNLPSSISDSDHLSDFCIFAGGKQPLEWRISKAKLFIEEWEWRLSILQMLLPSSERQWKWRESLSVLCAAPSMLLNLCMQKAKYDVGEQVINRFSLSSEDKAALELAQWMGSAFQKEIVRCYNVL